MVEVSAKDALNSAINNDFRLWRPSPKYPTQTAAVRFKKDEYFYVEHTPKFTIDKQESIFTMGSCFARNVENKLIGSGYNVTTGYFSLEPKYYNTPAQKSEKEQRPHRGVLNKYNVHSMYTELLAATHSSQKLTSEQFIKVGEDLYFDPQASNTPAASIEEVSFVREEINKANSTVVDADVVFLTLGLTETWFDRETSLSLNTPPSPTYMRSLAHRLYFHNASFNEVYELLSKIVSMVQALGNGKKKILITVSPVPLGSTYSGKDVVMANTYSKSTLRSAAQQVADENSAVDYFPSYEIAVNSNRQLAFGDDAAHVRSEMVAHIMQIFGNCYLSH